MKQVLKSYKQKKLRHVWTYHNPTGNEVLKVARYDDHRTNQPKATKDVIPYRPSSDGWEIGALDRPRPLYHLPGLTAADDAEPIIIVEGEKCAEALASLGLLATTWPGGSNAVDHADWRILSGRKRIYILPDNDAPGAKAADSIAAQIRCLDSPPEILLTSLAGLPPGGDVIDWLIRHCEEWDGFEPIPEQYRPHLRIALQRAIGDLAVPAATPLGENSTKFSQILPLHTQGVEGAPPLTYPVSSVPPVILRAATEISRFVKVPVVSPITISLSVLAVSFGKRVRIEEREGLYHWPSIFFSLIAETGERKGPPFKLLTSPLEEWAEHEELRRRKIRLAADAKNAAIDAATTALKTRARHDDADIDIISAEIEAHESRRVPTPPSASIFTTDITEERLFQKMHERGGVYAVLSGEGRPVIDALLGKYTSGNLTGDAIYLAGITGDTITRDRVGDGGAEERIIRDPALNVCIMVQPDKFSELAVHHSLKSSGALARIWPTILPSLVGTRLEEADEPGLQMQHLSPYYDLVHHLLGLCHTSASEGARPTHTIKLSSGAANARREWHNRIEWQMATGEELEDARDIACRAVTQTCKLALIIHVAENPEQLASDDSTLSLETWLRAEEIGNFHLQEAVRIRRMSEQDPLIENALRTIEWIVRKRLSRVSARDLQRSGPRPRPNADDALRVLSLLEEHGYLARRVEPGKKPSFIVNPQVLSPDSPMSPGNPGTQDH